MSDPLSGTPQGGSSPPQAIRPPKVPPSALSGQLAGGNDPVETALAQIANGVLPGTPTAAAEATMPAGIVAASLPGFQAFTQAVNPFNMLPYSTEMQAAYGMNPGTFGAAGLLPSI